MGPQLFVDFSCNLCDTNLLTRTPQKLQKHARNVLVFEYGFFIYSPSLMSIILKSNYNIWLVLSDMKVFLLLYYFY